MTLDTDSLDHRALQTIYRFMAASDLPQYRLLLKEARAAGDYTPETYGNEKPSRDNSEEALKHRLRLSEQALQKIDVRLLEELERIATARRKALVRLVALSHSAAALAAAVLVETLFQAGTLVISLTSLVFVSCVGAFILVSQASGNRYGFVDAAARCKKLGTRAAIALAALTSIDRSEKLSNYEVEDELVEIESIIEELQEI